MSNDEWSDRSLFVGGVTGALIAKLLDLMIESYDKNPIRYPWIPQGLYPGLDMLTVLLVWLLVAGLVTAYMTVFLRRLMK